MADKVWVRKNEHGEIEELLCKICGTAIGGLVAVDGGKRLFKGREEQVRVLKFRRFHNYAEATILFDDGSRHVTNGCKTCIAKATPEQLQQMHWLDVLDVDGDGYADSDLKRTPLYVVGVK